jgi:hypothetical protein
MIEDTSKENFLKHVWKKPRSRLIEIIYDFDILHYPENETTYVLVNEIVRFSHELLVKNFPKN